MPTYDYKCGNCEHMFEKFESIMARPSRKCPQCKKMQLKRLIGAGAGIIFKGSGFYETDYRSESYKEGAKKAEAKPAKTEKKTETKAAKETPKKKSEDKPQKPAKK